jgi:RecA/RadA recombinase
MIPCSYEAARRKDMAGLTETIKGTLIQGNQPTEEQITMFATQYAELGGKQKGFNKYMMDLYRSANTSQAEQIQGSLSNPFSYKVQLLMGGDE